MKDPIDVSFGADEYFTKHHIDSDADYKPGVTFRQEYDRQLQLRQTHMNDLTVGEWQHNVTDFHNPKSGTYGRISQNEQRTARRAAGGVPDVMPV